MRNIVLRIDETMKKKGISFYFYFFILMFHIHVMPYYISFFFNDLFYYEPYQLAVLDLEKYSYYVMLIFLAASFIFRWIRDGKLSYDGCQVLIFLFTGWMIFSAVYNFGVWAVPYDFFLKMAVCELIMQCVFMFITASRISEQQFKKMLAWCCVPVLIVLFLLNMLSLICYFGGFLGETITVFGHPYILPAMDPRAGIINPNGRYAGFYGSSGILGILCIVGMTMSVYYLLNTEKMIGKIIAGVSAASNVLMIILSNSRTGLIAIVINILFTIAVLFQKRMKYSVRKSYLVSFLIGAGIVLFFVLIKWNSLLSLIGSFQQNPSFAFSNMLAGRVQLFQNAIRQASVHPWIGCGWNAKVEYFLGNGEIELVDSAHNVFVTAYFCGGWIGLGLFVLFLICCLSAMVKNRKILKENQMLLCMVLVVFVQCLTEQGILGDTRYANSYLFWLILGYLTYQRKDIIS